MEKNGQVDKKTHMWTKRWTCGQKVGMWTIADKWTKRHRWTIGDVEKVLVYKI